MESSAAGTMARKFTLVVLSGLLRSSDQDTAWQTPRLARADRAPAAYMGLPLDIVPSDIVRGRGLLCLSLTTACLIHRSSDYKWLSLAN